ncbi:hypothetical protein F5888DRAFT_1896710 [Russula emetica]|nr:hypothetical protein F5888DRAFT_1896710 [Russula emetica]
MSGQTDPTSTGSTGKPGQCVFCPDSVAIYTCPRCATRTCSLPCSATHKTRTGCSGVREKAKFVPMNRYTCGTMMDDYVFLEDMSRKVGEWGQGIVRGGYGYGHSYGTLQGGRRGRAKTGPGPPGKTWSGGISRKKRDILKSQLELRDIELDLFPSGMERRTLNQSTWDSKKRTAFLTVEYNIHHPPTLDTSPNDAQEPYTLLTHRNNFDLSLRDLFQSQISQRSRKKSGADLPAWFAFIKLDSERKLSTLLRNKHFVEFPTIEVWEEGAFRGVLFDGVGAFESQGGQRPIKRRRLDVTKGRAAIVGLLGGYGSEDGEEVDTALTRLGEYEGSDEENEQPTTSEEADTDTDGVTEDGDDDEEEPQATVDPETLLAMVREAQRRLGEDGEFEEIDWGESDGDN